MNNNLVMRTEYLEIINFGGIIISIDYENRQDLFQKMNKKLVELLGRNRAKRAICIPINIQRNE